MKIAVITGASSGMGKEYVKQIAANYLFLDEIWVIGRSKKKLYALQKEVSKPIRVLPMDLRKREAQERLKLTLEMEEPRIKLLVNCAGIGKVGDFSELSLNSQRSTVRLNCESLTAVTYLALPYMHRGSHIIQMASAAAFAPQPGFAIYAATKSYVMSFARALRTELKPKGITVTCVCPGPVDTPFLVKAQQYQESTSLKEKFLARPEEVVEKAIKDAAVGRELSIYGSAMLGLFAVCKMLPHSIVIAVSNILNHAGEEK